MALQYWFPLTQDSRQQGLNSAVSTVMGTGITFVAGKLGKAAQFPNNCNSCINVPGLNLQTGSWAAWIKVNGAGATARQCLISEGRDSYNDGVEFYTNQAGTTLYFKAHEIILSTTINLNQWYHVIGTFGDNTIKLYVDGVLKSSNTYTNAMTYTYSNNRFVLGKMAYSYTNTGNYFSFNGCLNDVRIYDHVLSEVEVKELSKGLVLHYPLNDTSLDSKPNLVPSNYWTGSKSLSLSANTTSYSFMNYPTMNVQPNKTYYWTVDVRVTSGAANLTNLGIDTNCIAGGYSGNDSAHTVVTVVNPNLTKIKAGEWQTAYCITTVKADATNPQILHCLYGASSTATTVQVEYRNLMLVEASSRVPLRFWQSDIGYDCSGYCNNGNKVGTLTCDSDTPRYNVSTHFNGSSAIKNNNFPFSSNQWTASFWYKFTAAPSAYQGFLCLSRNAGGDADKKIAAMPNSNYIWIKFESINYTLSSLKINEWCHIALTCDGNVGKVYENGALKYTTGSVGSILTDCDDFVVGARANSADAATTAVYLNGNMSDVRIYATALSAEDILELYHTAARIDNVGNTYVYQYIET